MTKAASVRKKPAKSKRAAPSGAKRAAGRPARNDIGAGPDMLIATTCDLLGELAPERITLAEVARRSHVDPKLIRYYFKDRSSLLRAAASALSERFQQMAAAANDPNDTAEQYLRKRFATFLEFQLAYPYFRRLVLDEIIPSEDPAAAKLLEEITVRGAGSYQKIVEAGHAEGTMRTVDPGLFYLCLIGIQEMAAIGAPILRKLGHPAIDSPDYVERFSQFVMDLLMNGLRARDS